MKKIYLIGNPNVGKTSLFNILTHSNESVGNYGGTTVHVIHCIAETCTAQNIQISDVAGIYAFDAKKAEESLAWREIESVMGDADITFVQVINAGQWRKSLMLTLDLKRKGIHPILFFNTKKTDNHLGKEFYIKVAHDFALPVFSGDVHEKNFPEIFWKKFFIADRRLHTQQSKNKTVVPKVFDSYADQEQYITNLFDQFSSHTETQKLQHKTPFFSFLDRLFLHSFFGIITFFIILYAIFEMTFAVGAIPMDWIDQGTSWAQEISRNFLGDSLFSSFIADGIIAGVGGTLIFLPNIIILFFFLSLLKDSGYLARISFLCNAFFQKIGVSGKASVPLLMGFGCNVPSIMAIKIFETKKEQVIVAMMTLFMSCGARLPLYTLLIAAFIPSGFQGITLFGIYLFGIGVSFMTGKIMSIAYKPKQKNTLVAYEIPHLQLPEWKITLRFAFEKGRDFLITVGKFIVPVSIILWALFTFPITEVAKNGVESSYGASLGKTIEPIFRPMGFDWKISTGLISGIAAKEVMVTTFAQLYHAKNQDESLQDNLKQSGIFTVPVALALMIFVLLYTPCLAVIGAVRTELGNSWAIFALFYPSVIAWIFSYSTFILATYFLI